MSDMNQALVVFEPLLKEIEEFIAPAMALEVTDAESMNQAQEFGKVAQSIIKRVQARRKEYTEPLQAQVKYYIAAEGKVLESIEKLKAQLGQRLLAHSQKLEKVRAEALRQKQIEENARMKAEHEERERIRREAEAARKAELEAAELAAKEMGMDPEEAKAAILNEQRKEAMVMNQELTKEAVKSQVQAKQEMREIENMRVKGTQKVWTFEIVDKSKMPIAGLVPDEKWIREQIRMGARNPHIPGVNIFQQDRIAMGR